MSKFGTKDFLIEVAKGNIPGHSLVHKFGRNDGVPNGSWEHLSLTPFATANFRQSPVSMRIKAGGNAADTALGAGAQAVAVQGIDSNFNETTEVIFTTGASASLATTATFWRLHRAWVSSAGTYTGANTGAVVIEDSGGASDFLTIDADEGQSQYTGWTVPVGKTAYLLRAWGTVDASKAADIKLIIRKNIDDVSAPMEAKRLKLWWDGILGAYELNARSPEISIPEKSDIWIEARGGGAGTEVTGNFELLIVDN